MDHYSHADGSRECRPTSGPHSHTAAGARRHFHGQGKGEVEADIRVLVEGAQGAGKSIAIDIMAQAIKHSDRKPVSDKSLAFFELPSGASVADLCTIVLPKGQVEPSTEYSRRRHFFGDHGDVEADGFVTVHPTPLPDNWPGGGVEIVLEGKGDIPEYSFEAKVDVIHSAPKQLILFRGNIYTFRATHPEGKLCFSIAKLHDLDAGCGRTGLKLC